MRSLRTLLALAFLAVPLPARAQDTVRFTRADTLRGSIGPARAWWDVVFYDLHVRVNPADSSVAGWTGITYRVTGAGAELQVDLQAPLTIDSVLQDRQRLAVRRDGDAWFVRPRAPQPRGALRTIRVHYHGQPRVAKRAPWDGGIVWTHDSLGQPWIASAVQGLGASAWWPNKDTQADEPDSQRVAITVPDPLVDVSNGRLRRTTHNRDGTTTWEWFVTEPINNYDVALNVGHYVHVGDAYAGEQGRLTLDYWPLAMHEAVARAQFQQVKPMLACLEHWFGPYPWYRDGYKLVETPHLGMEHQSAVAYGNHFRNGYLGRDRSRTGLGLGWDFIIVHESAHEWFGNNITTKDLADMWVHESFANYAEALYTECGSGPGAGAAYELGSRLNVRNDEPIVAPYGVNREGSGDMYDKGGNMLHMIRELVRDDEKWRGVLRGLGATFRHRTVTGAEIQAYMARATGLDLAPVFAQYLTTTKLPVFEWRRSGEGVAYRWAETVPGFAMPVDLLLTDASVRRLTPTTEWQSMPAALVGADGPKVDANYYVLVREAPASTAGP